MLTNCIRFAPRDSVPGLISKICKYLKDHPGWSVEELKEVIGDIETSWALGEISYFTDQSINDLDTRALYDVGYRFVFIGGADVYSAMYALDESDGGVIANGVSLGVTESEFNQLKSIVQALNNAAYTETNPPPYPVTKVNNRTGDVKLDLSGVLGESTAQTMLMSEISFASTQLATWNSFYDYGYRVVGVLASDGSSITALYILGQNVGNHAPIPMALPSGGNVISVNGDIGEVFTLRVDPNDPGIPTDPPSPINATTLNGKSADQYMLKTDTAADSAKLGGVEAAEYIQHSAALTLEEIEASDDLSGKVASAEAAGKLSKKGTYIKLEGSAASVTSETWARLNKSVELTAGNWLFVCPFFRDQGGGSSVFKTYIAISKNDTYSGDAHLGELSMDWLTHSMGVYVLSVSEAGTYNVFVQHTSSTKHTIDIRSYFVRL